MKDERRRRIVTKSLAMAMAVGMIAFNTMNAMAAEKFDPAFYASTYPDVVAALGTDANALYDHYITYGRNEGRKAYEGAAGGEEVSSMTDSAKPADRTETTGITKLTDEQLAEYYGDSVFIGDSVMQGFRNYSANKNTFVHDIQFLTAVSYSANNALKPLNSKNVHPTYMGKKYRVWDALPLMGKKRAFILLGLNDLVSFGLEDSRDHYKKMIDKIQETSPDMEIHIVSVTYTVKGKGKGCLNNPNIDTYNALLREMAKENGWGYIDLCTPISDGEGNLAKNYCSDGFVHLKNPAYALWEAELSDYANAMQMETKAE